MSSGTKIYGLFNDDDILKNAAQALVDKGVKISEVYSPFPIHGIEKIIGMKWTRIAITAFMYGITGTGLALLGMWFFMIQDWPMNIGGKPSFDLYQNLPSFIPITFEFTVLCAAHGMAITYLVRNMTLPGMKARNPHPRTTDDHFALEVTPEENTQFSQEEIIAMLKDSGTVETFEK